MTIRILLADDHDLIQTGVQYALQGLPGAQVVARAATPGRLLAALTAQRCDVVITDFLMPSEDGADGLTMLAALRTGAPTLPIVVLTRYLAPLAVQAMRDAGAIAVLSRQDPLAELRQAVQAAVAGRPYLGGSAQRAADQVATERKLGAPALTWREVEILRLLADGRSTTEVARRLGRTVQTVSTQKRSAMRKLDLHNDVALYRYAMEQGLVV